MLLGVVTVGQARAGVRHGAHRAELEAVWVEPAQRRLVLDAQPLHLLLERCVALRRCLQRGRQCGRHLRVTLHPSQRRVAERGGLGGDSRVHRQLGHRDGWWRWVESLAKGQDRLCWVGVEFRLPPRGQTTNLTPKLASYNKIRKLSRYHL